MNSGVDDTEWHVNLLQDGVVHGEGSLGSLTGRHPHPRGHPHDTVQHAEDARQVPAHQLPGGARQHVEPVQEPAPLRQPEDRLDVRGARQEARQARHHSTAVGRGRP